MLGLEDLFMRKYELVLVLKTTLKEADRKKFLSNLKGLLKGFKVSKEEDMGQKPLSYPIKKEVAGYFSSLNFESENPVPEDFEKKLFGDDNVLRHLLIRI